MARGSSARAAAAALPLTRSSSALAAAVAEYVKWASSTREAMGRSLMEHQRKGDEAQAQLNALANKLRSEKSLTKQLQQKCQMLQFSAAAGGEGGGASSAAPGGGQQGAPMFRSARPAFLAAR